MRYSAVAAALMLALVGCDDDSTGPGPTTAITVTLDWPAAREEGFVEARWWLYVIQLTVDEGVFSADGTATVRYEATSCSEGSVSTGHLINVSGHFEGADRGCFDTLIPACTSQEQLIVIDEPRGDCTPPGG